MIDAQLLLGRIFGSLTCGNDGLHFKIILKQENKINDGQDQKE